MVNAKKSFARPTARFVRHYNGLHCIRRDDGQKIGDEERKGPPRTSRYAPITTPDVPSIWCGGSDSLTPPLVAAGGACKDNPDYIR